MPKYLTQEWLDTVKEMAQDFPEKPGATARMQFVITGAPEGDVKYFQVIDNGKMQESTLGEDPQADFTLSQSYEDARAVQEGKLDANAAFMQGKLRVTGNMGKLMQLMPLTQSQEYRDIQKKVNEVTEY